jgi:glycosyltransferase involved in cell wall biosynthesis
MTRPQVSILMPVRNEGLFLPAALASLRRQSLDDWELVAVDDGSDDATPAILAAAAADPRVRPLRSPGRGIVAALNAGLAQCRAPLVARMDGDDICHPRRLELQRDFLRSTPEVGLVACTARLFPRQLVQGGMRAYETWQNGLASHEQIVRDLYVESPFVHPSVMFRREEVRAAGGYRDMGWAEDYDLWLRLAAAGTRFARLPHNLFFWREHPRRATRTIGHYTLAAFRACKVHHLRQGFLRGVNAVALAGAGVEGRAWRRALEEAGIAVSLWVDIDPRKIGRTLHGARIVAPEPFPRLPGKMLITVGVRGAREELRHWAEQGGLTEGVDFLCVT